MVTLIVYTFEVYTTVVYIIVVPPKLNSNVNNEFNLPDHTINNILIAGNWMNEKFSDHLKPYALSIQQYQVLSSLRNLKGETTDLLNLTSQMMSKNSNTTRLVEKLRLKGLITREQNPTNRRKVDIGITEAGLELLEEIDPIQKSFEKEVTNNLSKRDLLTLNRLIEKMMNN